MKSTVLFSEPVFMQCFVFKAVEPFLCNGRQGRTEESCSVHARRHHNSMRMYDLLCPQQCATSCCFLCGKASTHATTSSVGRCYAILNKDTVASNLRQVSGALPKAKPAVNENLQGSCRILQNRLVGVVLNVMGYLWIVCLTSRVFGGGDDE